MNVHEHLLIGVKGSIPAPAPGTQWDSLISAPVGRHSAKPEVFLEMIGALTGIFCDMSVSPVIRRPEQLITNCGPTYFRLKVCCHFWRGSRGKIHDRVGG